MSDFEGVSERSWELRGTVLSVSCEVEAPEVTYGVMLKGPGASFGGSGGGLEAPENLKALRVENRDELLVSMTVRARWRRQ